jgi:hypothetical protein
MMGEDASQDIVTKLKAASLGMGWVAFILCWPIAVTLNMRFFYFLAGIVAALAAYVGFNHRHRFGGLSLIVLSVLESWWLFWLAFASPFWFYAMSSSDPSIDDAVKVMDALTRMIGAINK